MMVELMLDFFCCLDFVFFVLSYVFVIDMKFIKVLVKGILFFQSFLIVVEMDDYKELFDQIKIIVVDQVVYFDRELNKY